ncbi:MAG: hypothetical protein Q7R96_00340 [Nanoarchaeota archaeon]|nr:hypothetical protein [Nanoarchaeota archaeon]
MALVEKTALIGFESLIELLSLVMTFAIGYLSYKIFRLTSEKRYLHFSLSFFFITLAFLTRAFINAGIYFGRKDVIETALSIPIVVNQPLLIAYKALSLGYIILMLCAYLMLIILTFKIQDIRLVFMMVLFAIVSLVASYEFYVLFPIISFILLCYLVMHYYHVWQRSKKREQLNTLLGFIIIALAQVFFPLIYLSNRFAIHGDEWFVIGAVVQCIGYAVLFFGLLTVLKK